MLVRLEEAFFFLGKPRKKRLASLARLMIKKYYYSGVLIFKKYYSGVLIFIRKRVMRKAG